VSIYFENLTGSEPVLVEFMHRNISLNCVAISLYSLLTLTHTLKHLKWTDTIGLINFVTLCFSLLACWWSTSCFSSDVQEMYPLWRTA